MAVYTDQLGRKIELNYIPKRIISVVPSQTELLHSLGMEEEVIGITKFCVHPQQWFRIKIRIGGTKQLDIGKIKNLQPDLIIANKEENTRDQIEKLAIHFPVWISDVNTLEDALSMIYSIGNMLDKKTSGITLFSYSLPEASTVYEPIGTFSNLKKPALSLTTAVPITDKLTLIPVRGYFESASVTMPLIVCVMMSWLFTA